MNYKVDSPIAEEFIHDGEILDTIAYAQAHKNDKNLIEEILNKAANYKGISHREAAVLLECDEPQLLEKIFALAKEIKQRLYGNRIEIGRAHV